MTTPNCRGSRGWVGLPDGVRLPVGDEKAAVLERMTRRYFPGRTIGTDYHPPTDGDLKITALLAIDVEEVNGKRRTGPPLGPEDADDSSEAFGTRGVVPVLPTGEVGAVEPPPDEA